MAAAAGGMAELENAVICAFMPVQPTTDTDEQKKLRAQAVAYLDSVKSRPDAWATALQLFLSSARFEVKFWCLQVCMHAVVLHMSCPAPFSCPPSSLRRPCVARGACCLACV